MLLSLSIIVVLCEVEVVLFVVVLLAPLKDNGLYSYSVISGIVYPICKYEILRKKVRSCRGLLSSVSGGHSQFRRPI